MIDKSSLLKSLGSLGVYLEFIPKMGYSRITIVVDVTFKQEGHNFKLDIMHQQERTEIVILTFRPDN